MGQITTRPATTNDAGIIAAAVAMAIGETLARQYCGDEYMNVLEELARNEHSQYSYHNAIVAESDGAIAGAIVGYDGARLHELREHTFKIIGKHSGTVPSATEDETNPDEFYLDSLGVLPEFRGQGIGGKLLTAMRDKALSEGHKHIGLLVDFENPKAERLYISLGFERVENKKFLGHDMWHLQYVKTKEKTTKQQSRTTNN